MKGETLVGCIIQAEGKPDVVAAFGEEGVDLTDVARQALETHPLKTRVIVGSVKLGEKVYLSPEARAQARDMKAIHDANK